MTSTLAGQQAQVGCAKSETLQNLDVHGRTLIKNNVVYITTALADMDFTWVDRNTTIVLNVNPSGGEEIKLPQATSHNVGMVIRFMVAIPTTEAFKIGVRDSGAVPAGTTKLIGGLILVGDADEGVAAGAIQNALLAQGIQSILLEGDETTKGGDAGTLINFTYATADVVVVDGIVTADVDSLTGSAIFNATGTVDA